jgi:ABC-type amino acid transport substrate-binding protein
MPGMTPDLAQAAVQMIKDDIDQYRVAVKPEAISMQDYAAIKQERSEILSFAPTPYDLIGGGALVAKASGIKRWEDLRGKVACVSQGSNFAKPLAESYGAVVKGLRGIPESLLALKGTPGPNMPVVEDTPPSHA